MPRVTAGRLKAIISEHMRRLGKKGGAKGGKARAAKLTPEQRQEGARKAALARWKQKDQKRRS
jgi:hypothetical protein